MKRLLFPAICLALFASTQSEAQTNVGVSVSIGQPGYYGTIDINNYPAPRIYYPKPVVIQPVPVVLPPVYLRVPPGHRKHWSQHCAAYNACGQPVYFVTDNWYNGVYAPQYRGEHHDDDYRSENDGRRNDYHNNGHDDEHDHSNGHGHGHGHH